MSWAIGLTHHSTSLYLLHWEGTWNLTFCVKFEMWPWWDLAHRDPQLAGRCYIRLSYLTYAYKEGFEVLHKQWMPMLTVLYPTCCTQRIPEISNFVWNLRVDLGGTRHNVINKSHTKAITSSSQLSHASNEGFGTLHKQWMALLEVHHPICCTERVPKFRHFVCNSRVDLCGKWYKSPLK